MVVKRLYEAMMQMSDGMGVNCGFCHHPRNFVDWSQSTPMRWTGYSGIVDDPRPEPRLPAEARPGSPA